MTSALLWLSLVVDWGVGGDGPVDAVTASAGPLIWVQTRTESVAVEPLNLSYEFVSREADIESRIESFIMLPPTR